MPPDRGRVKKNLRAAQRREPCGFRVPLIPADADADLREPRGPRAEAKIAWREIELFVKERVVRNVHLAVFPEEFAVRVDDHRGIVVKAGAAFLEDGCDDHDPQFRSERAAGVAGWTGNL